jgi:hypothetical protein
MKKARLRTKDLYIASYLLATGEKYYIEKDGEIIYFIFENDKAPTENIYSIQEAQYWDDNALVSPKSLFNAYKELRSRVFMELQK